MSEENKDKSSRLLISIAIFGGTWFVFRGITDLWISAFSEIAYSNSIVNLEHALAIWLFVVSAVISGMMIRYMYFEYKTYQKFFRHKIKQNFEKDADKAFGDIFVAIKVLLISSLVYLGLIIFLNYIIYIKIKSLIVLIISGIIIGLLVFLTHKKISRKIIVLNTINNETIRMFGIIIYLTLITAVFSLYLMVFSISDNQSLTVKIAHEKEVPILIKTDNLQNPFVEILIMNTKKDYKKKLKISEDEITKSMIEVYESENETENFLINKSTNNNYKLMIKKTKLYSESKIELGNYLLQGENLIEITIKNKDSVSEKVVKISTVVNLKGSIINISRDEFFIEM